LNHDSIRALRNLLKLIFDYALTMGILDRNSVNPVLGTKVPRPKVARTKNGEGIEANEDQTYAYSLDEIFAMLNVLDEPARTAVAVAAFTGVRRGELTGMRWEDFTAGGHVSEEGVAMGSINVSRSVWEGFVTQPKTKKSKAPVPAIPFLVKILEAHRLRSGMSTSGPIFASSNRRRANCTPANLTPMNMNNLLNRHILPALSRCAECGKPDDREHSQKESHAFKRDELLPVWRGWHAFRRGLGTNLKALGVDLKTIQEILRHAHIATTADIYVKEVSAESVAAMVKLEQSVGSHIEAAMRKQDQNRTQDQTILQ
jgi:integrase